MADLDPRVRLATADDLPALHRLIPEAVRAHSRGYYDDVQVESALRFVFGPDTQLIADGTYFVVEVGREIVASGGWSRRATLFGGDQMKAERDPLLDPSLDAARIRAFFVAAAWGRRGLGSLVMRACMDAARENGFKRLELVATLPGEPLYRRFGFEAIEPVIDPLPDGVIVPFVRMGRAL